MPEIAFGVVLLNWNGCDDTIASLESLIAADPRPARVVVTDNGSSDASVERLIAWAQETAPGVACIEETETDSGDATAWLTIIRAADNRGFAGGNNIGLRHLATHTEVSHFLLLNNDAMVARDYFARVQDALAIVPDAGLVGCAIFHDPARERVWFCGGYEIPWRALILHRFELPSSAEPQVTPFVTGCAMVISRPLYRSEGGLAECFNPIYWEDGDYSFRARTHGWKLILAPAAHVYHRVRSTGGGAETLTPRVAFFDIRNRVIYVRRNYRGLTRATAMTYLAITKPGRAMAEVLRGRPAVGRAILSGWLHGISARSV